MAGGRVKYRHLNRSSSHRQALLRNLVTSLFQHESIQTTWHKAKEAQRLAEKLVTLAKRNTPAARIRAQQIFYTPEKMTDKLFGEIRERYLTRPGGYTRVLRMEPIKEDQAPSAILELVDGPKDMRFSMTARTLAHTRNEGKDVNDITAMNIRKVTRFRPNGEQELEKLIGKFEEILSIEEETGVPEIQKKKVYPDAVELNPGKKGPRLLRERQG